jgi:hypothetical protein
MPVFINVNVGLEADTFWLFDRNKTDPSRHPILLSLHLHLTGFPFIPEPVALSGDLHHMCTVQQPIQSMAALKVWSSAKADDHCQRAD